VLKCFVVVGKEQSVPISQFKLKSNSVHEVFVGEGEK